MEVIPRREPDLQQSISFRKKAGIDKQSRRAKTTITTNIGLPVKLADGANMFPSRADLACGWRPTSEKE